jgi:hypothetical protein
MPILQDKVALVTGAGSLIHSVRRIDRRARGTLPAAWPQTAGFSPRENPGGGSPGFSALGDQRGGIRSPRISNSTTA